jgi:hypothetical protein
MAEEKKLSGPDFAQGVPLNESPNSSRPCEHLPTRILGFVDRESLKNELAMERAIQASLGPLAKN